MTKEEIKKYVTDKFGKETDQEITSVMEATKRQLPECKESHREILQAWLEALSELLLSRNQS